MSKFKMLKISEEAHKEIKLLAVSLGITLDAVIKFLLKEAKQCK